MADVKVKQPHSSGGSLRAHCLRCERIRQASGGMANKPICGPADSAFETVLRCANLVGRERAGADSRSRPRACLRCGQWCILASPKYSLDRVQKSLGPRRRRHFAAENGVESMVPAVELIGVRGILAHRRSIQVDACKDSAAARPCEHFSSHADVGRGLRVASHGSGCCRRIGADLELSWRRSWKPLSFVATKHQISALSPSLEAERSAGEANKHRPAPAVRVLQVTTPCPYSAPTMKAPFTTLGMTAIHFACRAISSGTALSGTDIIESITFRAAFRRPSNLSCWSAARAATPQQAINNIARNFFISNLLDSRGSSGVLTDIRQSSLCHLCFDASYRAAAI